MKGIIMKLHEILNTFITIVLLATIFLYWFVLYPELEKPEILVGNGVRVTYDFGTDVMRIEAEERFDPNKLAIPQIQKAFDDYNQVYTDRKNKMTINLDKVYWPALFDPMIKLEGTNGSMSFVHIDNIKSFEQQDDGTYTAKFHQGVQQIIWLKKPDEFTCRRIMAKIEPEASWEDVEVIWTNR